MPSEWTWKHVLALLAVFGAVAFLRHGDAQPLHVDHTTSWAYERVPHSAATDLERVLADGATSLARRPVQVRCEDIAGGKLIEPRGAVEFSGAEPAVYARIRPDVCAELAWFVQSPPERAPGCLAGTDCSPAIVRSADALTVLAHESMHLRGIRSEATAQCYAIQLLPRLAERLGADGVDGRALAEVEFTHSYARMPLAYRSSECRSGGRLDMHLGAPWPA